MSQLLVCPFYLVEIEVEFLEDFSNTLDQSIKNKVSDDVDSNQDKHWPLQNYKSGNHTIEVMVRNSCIQPHAC